MENLTSFYPKKYPCYQLYIVSIEAALFCLHEQERKCVDDSSRSE